MAKQPRAAILPDRAILEAERADLTRKLGKRDGEHGFAANCAAIRARLAEIDAELARG
jgi:hypothetical protein